MFEKPPPNPLIVWESTVPRSRETLLLDLENSPLLEELYQAWRWSLHETDPLEILANLLEYLRSVVFDLSLCNSEEIAQIVEQEDAEEIPLERFVERKSGLCRHFALVAYYFLERMRKERLIPPCGFEIVRMPVDVDGSPRRHAWLAIFFLEENRSFHFDPFWGILIDNTTPT
jgi:hypothetical protein